MVYNAPQKNLSMYRILLVVILLLQYGTSFTQEPVLEPV